MARLRLIRRQRNLSGDPAQDYLADALTDELTTSIARIRDTFVIGAQHGLHLQGQAEGVGKDLGVRYVLEGSVQPNGSQMRVNAQPIDADTGAHLWADQFDTPRADLFQTQDEIVARLALALELQLPEVEAARLKRVPAVNPDAEDLAFQCVAAVQTASFARRACRRPRSNIRAGSAGSRTSIRESPLSLRRIALGPKARFQKCAASCRGAALCAKDGLSAQAAGTRRRLHNRRAGRFRARGRWRHGRRFCPALCSRDTHHASFWR